MLKKILLSILALTFAASICSAKALFDQGTYIGVKFSPNDFTTAYVSSETLSLEAGDYYDPSVASTIEFVSVIQQVNSRDAFVYLPTDYPFRWRDPILEVTGAWFKADAEYRVAIMTGGIGSIETVGNILNVDSVDLIDVVTLVSSVGSVANVTSVDLVDAVTSITNTVEAEQAGHITAQGWGRTGYTTVETTRTFTVPSRSFVVTNYETTNVVLVNFLGITLEVDPAIGSSRVFPYQVNSVDVSAKSGTVSVEIEVRQ